MLPLLCTYPITLVLFLLVGFPLVKAYSKALSGVCLVINAQRVTGALEILFTSDGVHRGRDVGG